MSAENQRFLKLFALAAQQVLILVHFNLPETKAHMSAWGEPFTSWLGAFGGCPLISCSWLRRSQRSVPPGQRGGPHRQGVSARPPIEQYRVERPLRRHRLLYGPPCAQRGGRSGVSSPIPSTAVIRFTVNINFEQAQAHSRFRGPHGYERDQAGSACRPQHPSRSRRRTLPANSWPHVHHQGPAVRAVNPDPEPIFQPGSGD